MTRTVHLPTVEDTVALGRRLGARLAAGDLVVLTGPLGAGKTCLVRGIGDGLGVEGPVTSPTFVIAREHPSRADGRGVPLVHVDAYRLGGAPGARAADVRAELEDLDLDTDLTRAVVVVEWGEGLAEHLAAEHLRVLLHRDPDPGHSDPLGPEDGRTGRTAELTGPARLVDG